LSIGIITQKKKYLVSRLLFCYPTKNTDRVRLKKIHEYLDVLEELGPNGEPYTKHLDREIWELRPFDDRIYSQAGKMVNLFYFTIL